jgi:hypothetical protein
VLYNVEQTIQRGEPEDHSMDTCLALQKELAMDTQECDCLYTIAETRVQQLARSGAVSGGAKFRVRV